MTRPLRSTPITGASSLLRAGPPARRATVLTPGDSPATPSRSANSVRPQSNSPSSVVTRLPTFPARAADQAHAASMPDTTWPEPGHPPGLAPAAHHTAAISMSLQTMTTRQQRFGVTHLPGPHLTSSLGAFSTSLTTTVFSQRSMWWFEASARPATPKGQTFISCRTSIHDFSLPTSSLRSSFVAHVVVRSWRRARLGVVVLLRR